MLRLGLTRRSLIIRYDVTGPIIAVTRHETPDEQREIRSSFVHDIPVCEECRRTRYHSSVPTSRSFGFAHRLVLCLNFRKSDFDLTEITIRMLSADDPNPTPESFTNGHLKPSASSSTQPGHQTSITTYSKKGTNGPQRQSKRIRTTQRKEQKLAISKNMTVKEIKLLVSTTLYHSPLPRHAS